MPSGVCILLVPWKPSIDSQARKSTCDPTNRDHATSWLKTQTLCRRPSKNGARSVRRKRGRGARFSGNRVLFTRRVTILWPFTTRPIAVVRGLQPTAAELAMNRISVVAFCHAFGTNPCRRISDSPVSQLGGDNSGRHDDHAIPQDHH